MKRLVLATAAALAFAAGASAAEVAASWVRGELSRNVLPADAGATSYTAVYNAVEEADVAADAAWRRLSTRGECDAFRREMRRRYVEATGIGDVDGLRDRTPLNARTVATVRKDGCRIEKILFESRPGVFVTGLLFLPDAAKFAPPYAAILVSCGHSNNGKGAMDYQRGCVMAAQRGMAAFIYDPIGQGERTQRPPTNNCAGHNRFGALAALVGRSMAAFRIWDAVRAIDFLQSRPDVRPDAIGMMGNSGGGTMTALVSAIDRRVKAAAPSCYLSTIRAVYGQMGPQDAEQNVFGQLSFGLNHASLVLLGGNAVRMHCCHNDMFSFAGSRDTWRVVRDAAARCGLGLERYGMTDVPGPHGWKESLRASSVLWMRKWLTGDDSAAIDVAACRRLDVGFDVSKAEHGLDSPDYNVTPDGQVANLSGFRSVYECLKDDLDAAEKRRGQNSPTALGGMVGERAGIRADNWRSAVCDEISRTETNGVAVLREAFSFKDGIRVPAVTFVPNGHSRGPLLVLGDGARADWAERVARALADGHVVMVADVIGTGEICRMRHRFYGAKNPDEELAVMLYALGRSLVGVRAEEVLALADALRARWNAPATIHAVGGVAVAAAHAKAVGGEEKIGGVDVEKAPLGWAQAVRESASCRFADVVHGGLLDYDWIDLLR